MITGNHQNNTRRTIAAVLQNIRLGSLLVILMQVVAAAFFFNIPFLGGVQNISFLKR